MKKLSEIIGETYKGLIDPGTKKVLDKNPILPAKTVPGVTDDEKLFTASNVSQAPHPGKDAPVSESVIFEWRDYDSHPSTGDADSERSYKIQQALDQSRQWGDMASRSKSMSNQHSRQTEDKNKPAGLRNLHDKAKALHDELLGVYKKLGKHHEGQISDLLGSDKK